jgi:hypothetical protein
MGEKSRIRFNLGTKEIEVEGSESFVKTYFGKLQAMISGAAEKKVPVKRTPKAVKAASVKADKKKPKAVKAKKATKKKPGVKRVTNIDVIVGLIQGAPEGISTAELKEKTGLAEIQIWSIIARATKLGKIRKVKRGIYGVVG